MAGALFAALAATVVQRQEPIASTTAPLPSAEPTAASRRDRIAFPASHPQQIALPGGDVRTVQSVLRVPYRLRYGQFVWAEDGVGPGEAWVRVDLGKQLLSVFRGGHEIGAGVILYGADSMPTPKGRFPVLERLRDHRSSLYDAAMPYTLRLTHDGVAIHGSNVIKGMATHGCIGLPSPFAALVFDAVQRGDPVYIVG